MAEFEFKNVRYQSRLLEDDAQWLLAKRMTPVFTATVGAFEDLRNALASPMAEDATDDEKRQAAEALSGLKLSMKQISDLVMPVSRELANLKDEDVSFILRACMDVTQRQGPNGGWISVRANGVVNNRADQNFAVQCKIAWEVIGENFADMFAGFGIDLRGMMAKVSG